MVAGERQGGAQVRQVQLQRQRPIPPKRPRSRHQLANRGFGCLGVWGFLESVWGFLGGVGFFGGMWGKYEFLWVVDFKCF